MSKKRTAAGGLRLCLLGLAGVASVAVAAPDCRLLDLGDVPGGDVASWAHGINRAGVVVGKSWGEGNRSEAFVYNTAGMQSIAQPIAVAHAVNRGGEVVGVVEGVYAFRWHEGLLTVLQDLPGGGIYTQAYGINDRGVAVGVCMDDAANNAACLWPAGGTQPVRLDAGPYASVAYGINRYDDVVGVDRIVSPFRDRAVMWRQGVMTELVAGSSQATAINDNGVVVGWSEFGAFQWRDGVLQMLPSGSMPSNHQDQALAINRQGSIVGSAMWGAKRYAAIWKKGKLKNLNTYACVKGSGWDLREATGINDRGDIVGNGVNPDGHTVAFKIERLVPSEAD